MDYQKQLEELSQTIVSLFDEKDAARETSLSLHRQIIKLSGNAIKLMHRRDLEGGEKLLEEAGQAIESLASLASSHPDVYHAGFIQSAQKEYSEACIFQAIISFKSLPTLKELRVDLAPYLNGLGEAIGELRRYMLDNLRRGEIEQVEAMLQIMDDLYYTISAVDYPDAITLGLRRTADVARSLVEKTRGDLTTAWGHHRLEEALRLRQI